MMKLFKYKPLLADEIDVWNDALIALRARIILITLSRLHKEASWTEKQKIQMQFQTIYAFCKTQAPYEQELFVDDLARRLRQTEIMTEKNMLQEFFTDFPEFEKMDIVPQLME